MRDILNWQQLSVQHGLSIAENWQDFQQVSQNTIEENLLLSVQRENEGDIVIARCKQR